MYQENMNNSCYAIVPILQITKAASGKFSNLPHSHQAQREYKRRRAQAAFPPLLKHVEALFLYQL